MEINIKDTISFVKTIVCYECEGTGQISHPDWEKYQSAYEQECKKLKTKRLSLEQEQQLMVDFWVSLLDDETIDKSRILDYTALPEEECECPECEGTGEDTFVVKSFSGEELLDIIKKARG